MAPRYRAGEKRLMEHTRELPELEVGQIVHIQNGPNVPNPLRWERTGEIKEYAGNSQYHVKVHPTGRVSVRNRIHLRPAHDGSVAKRVRTTVPEQTLQKDPRMLARVSGGQTEQGAVPTKYGANNETPVGVKPRDDNNAGNYPSGTESRDNGSRVITRSMVTSQERPPTHVPAKPRTTNGASPRHVQTGKQDSPGAGRQDPTHRPEPTGPSETVEARPSTVEVAAPEYSRDHPRRSERVKKQTVFYTPPEK